MMRIAWGCLGAMNIHATPALWRWWLCLALVICAISVSSARAQYLYMDADGDQVHSESDRMFPRGATVVDVWLITNETASGARVATREGEAPLSIMSYELALRAVGGTVEWGEYTNRMSTMGASFGRYQTAEELYVGFGGQEHFPPGKYWLGTIELRVLTGEPCLEFLPVSNIYPPGFTSFGSARRGVDEDYTLKLGGVTTTNPLKSDWADAEPLKSAAQPLMAASAVAEAAERLRFAVALTGNGRRGGAAMLKVTTTKSGPLLAHLYDIQGRLVRTLLDERSSLPGHRVIGIDTPKAGVGALPSGVYFYRVDSVEGSLSGRIVLLH